MANKTDLLSIEELEEVNGSTVFQKPKSQFYIDNSRPNKYEVDDSLPADIYKTAYYDAVDVFNLFQKQN